MPGVDPVTFQVLVSRLSGIVQEMQDRIYRTGYSTIVRESHDASCLILDADGNVVGEHVVIPLHITALPGVVRAVRERFGNDIQDGDAFITNHPYLADVTHTPDFALVTPLIIDGRLVAFCGSIAHKSDLGGMRPGTSNGTASEIFQEGTLYPPIRYVSRGKIERDVEALIRANTRTPQTVVGDLHGQLGVSRLGERRLRETIDRYGLEAVLSVFGEKLDRTELRVRHALRSWRDGVVEAERSVDSAGGAAEGAIRYHVRVEKTGDRILFDFSGSSDQVSMPINVRPAIVRGCIYYALIGLIDSTIENNGGLARAVEIRVRRGSILDPNFPAPSNAYMNTSMTVTELLIAALSQLTGTQVADVGGVGGSFQLAGRRSEGGRFSTFELVASAYGASSLKDGASGVCPLLTNAHAAPLEIMESESPIRYLRWELIVDSGGPGTHRGGLGPVRELKLVAPEAMMTLLGGKHAVAAAGILGGLPGRLGNCTANPGSAAARSFPSRFSGEPLRTGDVVRLEKSGGGGVGPPIQRDFDAVVDDVLDGYVSRDAAISIYGVDPARLDATITTWEESVLAIS